MIVNLTPHPIRFYDRDAPDRIDPAEHQPWYVLESTGNARIGQIDLGTQYLSTCPIPVEYVEYRRFTGLPERVEGTWLVVSLALALASDRPDLLVPYLEVRNLDGTVIGCRLLARPV